MKVLDFGIAILRGAGALPRLTQVDRTVGTPAYMSPEQCLGQVVTAACDIYFLGCLLLELLTGDTPFHATADTPLRSHHLNTPAPSARPTATAVYEALLPQTAGTGGNTASPRDRDPTRPFRWPLLAPAASRGTRAEGGDKLTDAAPDCC